MKLSWVEAELKKSVAYKKKRVLLNIDSLSACNFTEKKLLQVFFGSILSKDGDKLHCKTGLSRTQLPPLLLSSSSKIMRDLYTARKVSKYGVFSGPYFAVFNPNAGKYGPEKTLYLDAFHVVLELRYMKGKSYFVIRFGWKENFLDTTFIFRLLKK